MIATRVDPPLSLARMRARGALCELRVEDLRCTTEEGMAIVAGVAEVGGDAALATAERTEGWPAGLLLAALTLRGATDPAAAAVRIIGGERHMLDYFSTEVLNGLLPDQRQLLVQASVLERLSGPLCDAVLQRSGCAAVLDQLAGADLFITPLDAQWYRCHRLFREVLRRELVESDTNATSVLLGRAADWFLAQGQIEEAVQHRIAAGDTSGALALLRSNARWFLDRGAMGMMLRLCADLPGAGSDPHLCLDLALAAGLSAQLDRSVQWLVAAESHIGADPDPVPGWRTLRAYADFIWAVYGTAGDVETALVHARRAVALETDSTLWGHVVALTCLGGELLGAGRVEASAEVLQRAWEVPARRMVPRFFLLQAAGLFVLALVQLGETGRARTVCADVRELASQAEQAWGDGAAAALAMLRLGEGRLIAATDPEAAIGVLSSAVRLAEDWGQTSVLVGALTSLTIALWATGDQSGARRALDQAHEAGDGEPIQPAVIEQLASLDARIGREAVRQARDRRDLLENLTDRELAVLRALRGPLSAREIGNELHLSINTVKGYTKSLYRKLGAVTRAQAVREGHDLGLI